MRWPFHCRGPTSEPSLPFFIPFPERAAGYADEDTAQSQFLMVPSKIILSPSRNIVPTVWAGLGGEPTPVRGAKRHYARGG